jgi:hypothetical protein
MPAHRLSDVEVMELLHPRCETSRENLAAYHAGSSEAEKERKERCDMQRAFWDSWRKQKSIEQLEVESTLRSKANGPYAKHQPKPAMHPVAAQAALYQSI